MKFKIQDESGDRKYFTIIPNYILNHSTIWDREVYIQMKRIAGENGTCWTSKQTLAKQCGISKRKLDECIKYLIDHKWIENIGKKKGITRGGIQEVNEYRIADLWDMNNSFYQEKYKGGAQETPPKDERGCTDEAKGGAQDAYKEEPYKEELNTAKQVLQRDDISEIIYLFKPVNPLIGKHYGNKTQRSAVERMLKVFGKDMLIRMVNSLPIVNARKYYPKTTTPLELENNIPKYKALNDADKQKKVENKNKVAII